MKYFRHGDLVFSQIKTIPKEANETKDHKLALGEMTGHYHALTKGRFKVYDLPNNEKVVEVETPTDLTHQEHKTIEIQPGRYKMHFEQEYDYCLESVRQVQD